MTELACYINQHSNLYLPCVQTDEEYLAEGYTVEQLPLIRRYDELMVSWLEREPTPEEEKEGAELVKMLGI